MVSALTAALLTRASLMALKTFGRSSAARMAITASTPIISISVKPSVLRFPARLVLIELTFIGFTVVLFAFLFLFLFYEWPLFGHHFARQYQALLVRTIRTNTAFVPSLAPGFILDSTGCLGVDAPGQG